MTWWGMYIRASWEKLALQQQQQQQQTSLVEHEGPPPYSETPPETTTIPPTTAHVDTPAEAIPSGGQSSAPSPAHTYPPARPHRRVDYDPVVNIIPEHEINAYGYRSLVRKARGRKKDKMLIFFWIPVLFVVLTWAMYTILPVAVRLVDGLVRPHVPPAWSAIANGGRW